MKVVLLVRSLERGGAERQLVMLARVLHRSGIDVVVVTFYASGPFEQDLLAAGVRVRSLKKSSRWDLAGFALRLLAVLRDERPDVLYGFVVTPNLLGSAIKPLLPGMRVVWGVRSARTDLTAYDWVTRLVYGLETRLSHLPDLVIVNSGAGQRHLRQRGFPREKVVRVPNGIDVEHYKYDSAGRARVRAEWGASASDLVVGIVARADPVKAHDVFLAAAKLINETEPRALFVCVGVNDSAATRLGAVAEELGIVDRLVTQGPRDGLPAVYSALDVLVMCSHSEGFPNVVAEAMSCGVPCVVTEVGDAVEIIGETGEHVPAAAPTALAGAVRKLLARLETSNSIRDDARRRIVERYSLESLAERTIYELRKLLPARSA